jgi:hypothetical protein
MLVINQLDIQQTGGLLAALTKKSEDYIRSVLLKKGKVRFDFEKAKYLDRIIVHTDPHIDEYVAELFFRACMSEKQNTLEIPFQELSIYSIDNDLNCKTLFPTSAVLGIGNVASGGAEALFLFDEHVNTGQRVRSLDSCSQVVASKFIANIPQSVDILLREINVIDSYGGAHPQHLGNLIKRLHDTRFAFDSQTWGYLSDHWKRAIVDACLAAVVYCLENKIDLWGEPKIKAEAVKKSISNYAQHSLHKNNDKFNEVHNRIRTEYHNQTKIFNAPNALLKDREGNAIRDAGKTIPQILLFSRVCFACEKCWGEKISRIITTHFWEVIFQDQINFSVMQGELKVALSKRGKRFNTKVGTLKMRILPSINQKNKLWVMSFSPNNPGFIGASKAALLNYINRNNNACGVILIENPYHGTKALFKGKIPLEKWQKLVKLIISKEKDYWYEASPNFILNGNKAHRYRNQSRMDINSLEKMIRETFY